MNRIVPYFPEASFIQVGDHYIPMALTLKADLKQPLNLFFPFAKGVVRLTGADRQEFLNNMCTGDVKHWTQGEGYRFLFTNSHGKVIFDVFGVLLKDEILIVTDPGEEERLIQHLEQFHIMEQIELSNVSQDFEVLYIFDQQKAFQHPVLQQGWQLFETKTGGMRVYLLPDSANPIAQLMESEIQPIGLELFDELRPIHSFARAGADFNAENLPQEASLEHAVCFTKGCYLGQEPISRVAFRGRVTKKVVTLQSKVPLSMGNRLEDGDEEVGMITSGSNFLTPEGYFALGVLRTNWLAKEEKGGLHVLNSPVTVVG